MHGQSGQATVEWVALVLLAALVLGAAAAFAGREPDRGLGELVAKRIARAPGEVGLAVAAASAPGAPAAPVPGSSAPAAPGVGSPSAAGAPAPPAGAPRRTATPPAGAPRDPEGSRAVRGIGTVAKRAWIGCLGYKRWRYEREHPLAAIEGLPVGEALGIANDCLNPYEFLFGD